MKWNKTAHSTGIGARYNGETNNRKVGVYDWGGRMTIDGKPPKNNVEFTVWGKDGNGQIINKRSDTAKNAMREAERYANGLPNYRGWIIVVCVIVILIFSLLLTYYGG